MTNENSEMSVPSKLSKRFTGYHATAIFVAFFAVVVAVNFTMAGLAISSFGGTVVDNSYVASQKYNQWLAQGRAQQAYGWQVSDPRRTADDKIIIEIRAPASAATSVSIGAASGESVLTSSSEEVVSTSSEEVEPNIITDSNVTVASEAAAPDLHPLLGAEVTIRADHPVGRADSIELTMQDIGSGVYRSHESLPRGRWKLKISISKGERDYHTLGEVR